MRVILLCISLLFGGVSMEAGGRTEALLDSLDWAVSHKLDFVAEKSARIAQLKAQPARTLEERYSLSKFLFSEYATFDSDSAWYYADRCSELAEAMQEGVQRVEAELFLALTYTNTGLFDAARRCLKNVAVEDSLPMELERLRLEIDALYHFHLAEYVGEDASRWQDEYDRLGEESRRRLLAMPESGHPDLLWQRVEWALETEGNLSALEHEVRKALAHPECMRPQSRARLYFSVAMWRKKQGDETWLDDAVQAALTDLHAANRDELAFQTVALELFERGDVERAYRYIQSTLEDALYYKNRIRFSRLADMQSIINKEYQHVKDLQHRKLRICLWIIGLLMTGMGAVSVGLIRQRRGMAAAQQILSQANERMDRQLADLERADRDLDESNTKLKQTVALLTEANFVKEEYIARMFTLCAGYINRMDEIRVHISRNLKAGQNKEALKFVGTDTWVTGAWKDFYREFDAMFLSIYPDFVERFNGLLKAEEQIQPKSNELLTPELRIYALIRLGITSRTRIAEILHYSLQTVYNYQTRTRARLKDERTDLERAVCGFGFSGG